MSFTLRIKFTGSCLFAPHPAADGAPDRMQVLLPSGQGGHVHADPHIPVLQFDTAHLYAGSSPSRVVTQVPIRSTTLTLDGTGASQSICQQIVSVREVVGHGVLPEVLEDDPNGLLATRVTLAAGEMTAVARGVCWEWEPGRPHRRMAHAALWEIPMEGDDLTLTLKKLGSDSPQPAVIPTLYPFTAGSERIVTVQVRHLPADELAIEPKQFDPPGPDFQAEHFAMYYPLFGIAHPPRLPRGPRGDLECGPAGCREFEDLGGTAFNCMVGGG